MAATKQEVKITKEWEEIKLEAYAIIAAHTCLTMTDFNITLQELLDVARHPKFKMAATEPEIEIIVERNEL